MFTPKVLGIIAKIIKYLEWSKVFLFSWDKKRNTLSITKSLINRPLTQLVLLHYIPYFFYNFYKLQQGLRHGEAVGIHVMDIFWLGIMTSGHHLCFEGVLWPYLKKQEMVTLFRQMTAYDNHQQTLLVPDLAKRGKFAEHLAVVICRGSVAGSLFMSVLVAIVYWIKPRAPQYAYSAWSGDQPWIYVLFFVYEAWIKSINIAELFLSQAWFIITVAYLTIGISTLGKSVDPLAKKVTFFRSLYLLNSGHNSCYLPTFLPFRFLFYGGQTVASTLVVIRLGNSVSLTEQLVVAQFIFTFFGTAILYLHISGKVQADSSALTGSLRREACRGFGSIGITPKNRREIRLWRRVTKSLRPFGIRVGTIRAISYAALSAFCITVASMLTTVLVTIR